MAAIDDILKKNKVGSNNQPETGPASIQKQLPIFENKTIDGMDGTLKQRHVDTSIVSTLPKQANVTSESPSNTSAAKPKENLSYVEMIERSSPYRTPSAEELETERKKRKREAIFSAIGDGISALSNLYFTTRYAPNSYDSRNSLSARALDRWDKIDKEREANKEKYLMQYMQARRYDDEKDRDDKNWRYKIGRDAIGDKRYDDQQKKEEQRYKEGIAYRDKKDQEAKDFRERQFEEGKRQFDVQQARLAQQSKDALAARVTAANAAAAKSARGRRIGFSDGSGNEVGIYEYVWKGSMQNVFDLICKEMENAHERDPNNNEKPPRNSRINQMKDREKEDFVKQNWAKYPSSRALMLSLSKYDPAVDGSEIQGKSLFDDDYDDDWEKLN